MVFGFVGCRTNEGIYYFSKGRIDIQSDYVIEENTILLTDTTVVIGDKEFQIDRVEGKKLFTKEYIFLFDGRNLYMYNYDFQNIVTFMNLHPYWD